MAHKDNFISHVTT